MSPHPARSSPVHHSSSPGLKAASCPPQRASAYEHPDAAGYYSRAGSSPDNLLSGSANRRREREMAAHAMGHREQMPDGGLGRFLSSRPATRFKMSVKERE